jgi:hypothetical protein
MKRAVKEKQTICAIIFLYVTARKRRFGFAPHIDLLIQCLLRLLLLYLPNRA